MIKTIKPLLDALGIDFLEDIHLILYFILILFWALFFLIFICCPLTCCFKSIKLRILYSFVLIVAMSPFLQLSKPQPFVLTDIPQAIGEKQNTHENIFHLMTFNLRDSRLDQKNNTWAQRTNPTIKTIVDIQPDLIGTQEGQTGQFEDMINGRLDKLGYKWFGEVTIGKTHDSAIIYNENTLELHNYGTFWLSETPDVQFSKFPDSELERSCTWGHFTQKNSQKQFYLFNTHFDHLSEPGRRVQSQIIVQKIKEITGGDNKLPIFWTGDFNSFTNSKVYKNVENAGFTDIQTIDRSRNMQNGQQFSFHAYQGDLMEQIYLLIPFRLVTTILSHTSLVEKLPITPFQQDFLIDFIFQGGNLDGVEMIQNFILTHRVEGRFPSDHYPMSALYKL